MFYIWIDNLMEVSGMAHTAGKRIWFVNKYGINSWKNWIGINRI